MTKTLKSIFALSCASISISYAADSVTTWCHNPYNSNKSFVVISGDQSFSPYKKSQDESSRSGSTNSENGLSPVSNDGMPPAYGSFMSTASGSSVVPLPSYMKRR